MAQPASSRNIDPRLANLYEQWLSKSGDAVAAATLVLAQIQSDTAGTVLREDSLLGIKEAAKYLGYEAAGLRKICKQQKVQYLQTGTGPYRFRREWLDEFIAANANGPERIERSPVQKRIAAPSKVSEPQFGFDPSFYYAESQSG